MGLVLRALSGVAVMASLAGTMVQPAAADKLGSTINLRVADTFPGVSQDDVLVVEKGVLKSVDFQRKKTPWICVDRPTISSNELGDLGELARTTEVFISVDFGRRPDGDGFVLVIIWVAGKNSASQTTVIPKSRLESGLGVVLRDQAVFTLEQLMDKVSPCTPKVKVKAKTKLTQDFDWTGGWEGETRLALGETGAFAGTFPVTYSWTDMVIPGGVCTVTISNSRSLMDVAGHFEEHDQTLKFTRAQVHGLEGLAKVSCTEEGETVTRSMPLPAFAPMEAATQYDIRIPLQQNARISIVLRPPAPNAVSDFTMDLAFEDEGPPVAVVVSTGPR